MFTEVSNALNSQLGALWKHTKAEDLQLGKEVMLSSVCCTTLP